MKDKKIKIGIIGDNDPNSPSHVATMNAISHAADYLSFQVDINWLPTQLLLSDKNLERFMQFDCLWASPGSPYLSMGGALRGIQRAREMNKPFIGT